MDFMDTGRRNKQTLCNKNKNRIVYVFTASITCSPLCSIFLILVFSLVPSQCLVFVGLGCAVLFVHVRIKNCSCQQSYTVLYSMFPSAVFLRSYVPVSGSVRSSPQSFMLLSPVLYIPLLCIFSRPLSYTHF
jgi:hypothetical protein